MTDLGAAADVGVGMSIWSRTRRDHNNAAVGGVVVEVLDDFSPLRENRRFVVLSPFLRPGDPAFRHVVDGDDIDPATIEPASSYRARNLVRSIAAVVSRGKGGLKPEHRELARWAALLAEVR